MSLHRNGVNALSTDHPVGLSDLHVAAARLGANVELELEHERWVLIVKVALHEGAFSFLDSWQLGRDTLLLLDWLKAVRTRFPEAT
jgi:hypothetical protein